MSYQNEAVEVYRYIGFLLIGSPGWCIITKCSRNPSYAEDILNAGKEKWRKAWQFEKIIVNLHLENKDLELW